MTAHWLSAPLAKAGGSRGAAPAPAPVAAGGTTAGRRSRALRAEREILCRLPGAKRWPAAKHLAVGA